VTSTSGHDELVARFLRETAHLGPEGQLRVLQAIAAAVEAKRSCDATQATTHRATSSESYAPIEERIDTGGPPPPGVLSTYTPPAQYHVDDIPKAKE
jgi:hypothetical protein